MSPSASSIVPPESTCKGKSEISASDCIQRGQSRGGTDRLEKVNTPTGTVLEKSYLYIIIIFGRQTHTYIPKEINLILVLRVTYNGHLTQIESMLK